MMQISVKDDSVMKKKIMTVCSLLIVFSLAFAFVSSGKGLAQSNVSTAVAEIYAAENEESTTSAVGNIVGDAVS